MLDRVHINIDIVTGVNKGNENVLNVSPGVNVSSWNKQKPIIAKFEVRTEHILFYLHTCFKNASYTKCFSYFCEFIFLNKCRILQVSSASFIGAKNIPRPQISFKDTIDNSDSLWLPKISDKPNNVKPLALNILYNAEGEAAG